METLPLAIIQESKKKINNIKLISHVQLLLCVPRSPEWPWSPSPPPQLIDGPYWSSLPIAWCLSARPVAAGGPGGPLPCAWAGPKTIRTNTPWAPAHKIENYHNYTVQKFTLTRSSYRGILCTGLIIRSPRACFSLFSRMFCCWDEGTWVIVTKQTDVTKYWTIVCTSCLPTQEGEVAALKNQGCHEDLCGCGCTRVGFC